MLKIVNTLTSTDVLLTYEATQKKTKKFSVVKGFTIF